MEVFCSPYRANRMNVMLDMHEGLTGESLTMFSTITSEVID